MKEGKVVSMRYNKECAYQARFREWFKRYLVDSIVAKVFVCSADYQQGLDIHAEGVKLRMRTEVKQHDVIWDAFVKSSDLSDDDMLRWEAERGNNGNPPDLWFEDFSKDVVVDILSDETFCQEVASTMAALNYAKISSDFVDSKTNRDDGGRYTDRQYMEYKCREMDRILGKLEAYTFRKK